MFIESKLIFVVKLFPYKGDPLSSIFMMSIILQSDI